MIFLLYLISIHLRAVQEDWENALRSLVIQLGTGVGDHCVRIGAAIVVFLYRSLIRHGRGIPAGVICQGCDTGQLLF